MGRFNYKGNITESWILRNWFMFDTFKWNFYLNENWNIKWIQAREINWWELIWEKSNNLVRLWIWNILIGIIKNKNFNDIDTLLYELSIAYSWRIIRLLESNMSQAA